MPIATQELSDQISGVFRSNYFWINYLTKAGAGGLAQKLTRLRPLVTGLFHILGRLNRSWATALKVGFVAPSFTSESTQM
jgi:hypothetical protein